VGLLEDVARGPIALDTAIFVYFIEEHPRYLPVIEPVFAAIDAGRLAAVTSGLTLLETLVVPYRTGNPTLADRYEALLAGSRGLRLLDLDRPLLRAAAQLRAAVRVETPDALQLAAALSAGATAYLTNDRDLPRIPGLRIMQLRDYVAGG
jgi:predicted nucleic acid-binding protein